MYNTENFKEIFDNMLTEGVTSLNEGNKSEDAYEDEEVLMIGPDSDSSALDECFRIIQDIQIAISYLEKPEDLYRFKLSNEDVVNEFSTKQDVLSHAKNQFYLNYKDTIMKDDLELEGIFMGLVEVYIELLEYKDVEYDFVLGSYVLDEEMGKIYDNHNFLLGQLHQLGRRWEDAHMKYIGDVLSSL